MSALLPPCLGQELLDFTARCSADPSGADCDVFQDTSRVPFVAGLPLCSGFSLPLEKLCDSAANRRAAVEAIADCMLDMTSEPECYLYANAAMQNAVEVACPGIHDEAHQVAHRTRTMKSGMIAVAGLGGLYLLFKVVSK